MQPFQILDFNIDTTAKPTSPTISISSIIKDK